MADTTASLKGTITVLVDKTDPLNPIFKELYPLTVTEQVIGLNELIDIKISQIPLATSSTEGLIKVGDNITNNSGLISIASDNIIDALGYVPIDKNATVLNSNTT